MADRRVTVKVDIQAASNLGQVAGAAAAQVQQLQRATKGAQAAVAGARAATAEPEGAAAVPAPSPTAGQSAARAAAAPALPAGLQQAVAAGARAGAAAAARITALPPSPPTAGQTAAPPPAQPTPQRPAPAPAQQPQPAQPQPRPAAPPPAQPTPQRPAPTQPTPPTAQPGSQWATAAGAKAVPPPPPPRAGAQWATAAAPQAQPLRIGIPIAQPAPPTARRWTPQDTLREETQKRLGDAEQKLAYIRSGPGQAATLRAMQAEAGLTRQQERLAQVARTGAGWGGAALRFAENAEPVTRRVGIAGAAGLAASYAGIASVSPQAESQITNSFRMVANEIGIATIPAAVRFTGALQSLARTIRVVNESTGGWAGSLAFTGALAVTGVGALGMVGNTVRSTLAGLRSLGILGEVGAAAGGQLAGQAAGRVAARVAGQTAGGAGAAAATTAAASTGGTAVGAVGTTAAGSLGATAALPIAAILFAIGEAVDIGVQRRGIAEDVEQRRGPMYTEGAPAWAQNWQNALQRASWVPGAGTAANLATSLLNSTRPEAERIPTHGFGAWLAESVGLGTPGAGQAGGVGNLADPNTQMFRSPEEMLNSMMMRVQQTPGPIAEQESRASQAFITALNRVGDLLQANLNAANQASSWGPAASENG